MQILAHNSDGTVTTYHTIRSREGTAGYECVGRVALSDLSLDHKGRMIATCPVAGCPGNESAFPLAGETEAQRLHAHVRLADPKRPEQTLADAIESVLADVVAQHGVPSLDLAVEGIAEAKDTPDAETQPMLSSVKSRLDELRAADALALALIEASEQVRIEAEALARDAQKIAAEAALEA